MAITIVSDSVLIESRSARDYQLERISPERALEILNKAKALLVALWQGTGVTTTEEIARYFEVESSVIRHASKQHRKDGWREVKGQENLKALRSIGSEVFSLPEATTRIAVWTPRAALRLAMVLRYSVVAKAVRTSLLDAIEQIIPAQSARIRELELELQVAQAQAFAAQSQERLMQATNAIANLHGTGMVALILGKPDAVITQTEIIEKTVAVDSKGRVLAQSDGMTIGYLIKRLGFKNNDQTWQWLNSVQLGKNSGAWSRELTAHPTLKLPRHLLPQIQRLFAYQVGNRQLLLGEGGSR